MIIWRRYSHITHLGEPFFDLKTFLDYFLDYTNSFDTIIANRLISFLLMMMMMMIMIMMMMMMMMMMIMMMMIMCQLMTLMS